MRRAPSPTARLMSDAMIPLSGRPFGSPGGPAPIGPGGGGNRRVAASTDFADLGGKPAPLPQHSQPSTVLPTAALLTRCPARILLLRCHHGRASVKAGRRTCDPPIVPSRATDEATGPWRRPLAHSARIFPDEIFSFWLAIGRVAMAYAGPPREGPRCGEGRGRAACRRRPAAAPVGSPADQVEISQLENLTRGRREPPRSRHPSGQRAGRRGSGGGPGELLS